MSSDQLVIIEFTHPNCVVTDSRLLCPDHIPPVQLSGSSRQLDLFPDVHEDYVAELIQKNNVEDLNV